MLSIFNKFKRSLKKTSKRIFGTIGGIFGFKQLDEKILLELEEAFYSADFGVETTREVIEAIRTAYRKEPLIRGQDALEIAKTVLKRLLQGAQPEEKFLFKTHPAIICLMGINGVGKTTTAGKLAHYFKAKGNSVLMGACDTFRAAANEQVEIWAKRVGVELVSSHHGADAAAVAFDAYTAAKSRGHNIVILDTAGRLHTKSHLMQELAKIRRVLQKQDPLAPEHCWLVIDGSLGGNSIEQAKVFHEAIGLTGLIVTKLDGTSRGGALVGIYRELKLPIFFVGLGESLEDLQPFSIDNYLEAIFDTSEDI